MIEIDRTLLVKACEVLGPVVSRERRRQTVPVLGHYLLRVQDGRLLLSVTDLDMVATMVVGRVLGRPSDNEPFALTADAAVLEAAARSTPPHSMVRLELLSDAELLITALGVTATALSCPASDFPTIPDVHDAPTSVKIGRRELLTALARTLPAVSREETRYYLNGVCVMPRDGFVHLVATDGHRMTLVGLSAHAPSMLSESIIPHETVRLLRHMLGYIAVDDVHLGISSQRGTFSFGDVTLTFKAIDGKFPDIARVIPDTSTDPFVVNTTVEVLRSALETMNFSEDGRPVALVMGEGAVRLADTEAVRGKIEVAIDPANYTAEPHSVGIKPRYLRDVVATISGPLELRMREGATQPIVFRASGHPGWLALVMPMRLL